VGHQGALDSVAAECVGAHAHKGLSLLYGGSIAAGVLFWDTFGSKRAYDSPHCASGEHAAKSRRKRTRREDWPDARYGERGNTGQQARHTAEARTHHGAAYTLLTFFNGHLLGGRFGGVVSGG
jgi:hypothetical protein